MAAGLIYGRLRKVLIYGFRVIYGGVPSFLGLGIRGHSSIPTFWLHVCLGWLKGACGRTWPSRTPSRTGAVSLNVLEDPHHGRCGLVGFPEGPSTPHLRF